MYPVRVPMSSPIPPSMAPTVKPTLRIARRNATTLTLSCGLRRLPDQGLFHRRRRLVDETEHAHHRQELPKVLDQRIHRGAGAAPQAHPDQDLLRTDPVGQDPDRNRRGQGDDGAQGEAEAEVPGRQVDRSGDEGHGDGEEGTRAHRVDHRHHGQPEPDRGLRVWIRAVLGRAASKQTYGHLKSL